MSGPEHMEHMEAAEQEWERARRNNQLQPCVPDMNNQARLNFFQGITCKAAYSLK